MYLGVFPDLSLWLELTLGSEDRWGLGAGELAEGKGGAGGESLQLVLQPSDPLAFF